jgi:hypothetical protein
VLPKRDGGDFSGVMNDPFVDAVIARQNKESAGEAMRRRVYQRQNCDQMTSSTETASAGEAITAISGKGDRTITR